MYYPPITEPSELHPTLAQGPLELTGQHIMARNTLSGPWPDLPVTGTATPLASKLLGPSLQATPASIPTLPLMSPSVTPCLGIGFGGLASCTSGHSLDHVMPVATDPMSRHFIHLNMLDVEVDHEAMDALMEVEEEIDTNAQLKGMQQSTPRFGDAMSINASLSPCPQPHQQPLAPEAATIEVPNVILGQRSTSSNVIVMRQSVPQPAMEFVVLSHQQAHGRGALPTLPLIRPSSAASSDTDAHSPLRSRRSLSQQLSDNTHVHHPRVKAGVHGAEDADDNEEVRCGRSGHDSDEAQQAGGLSVAFLDDNGYFDMTLKDAADQLGVGVTTLKKLCRQSGLGRWPYRARCSLRNLRDKMREYFACAPVEEREAADALMEKEFCRLARMNVGAIDDAFKQFRQAMFKLEFKARQQLDAGRSGAGGGAGRKKTTGAAASAEGELNVVFHGDAAFRQQAMLHLRRLLHACSDGTY